MVSKYGWWMEMDPLCDFLNNFIFGLIDDDGIENRLNSNLSFISDEILYGDKLSMMNI